MFVIFSAIDLEYPSTASVIGLQCITIVGDESRRNVNEARSTLSMLADEIIIAILEFLPLCEVRNKARWLCRQWHICSKDVIHRRLKKCLGVVFKYEYDVDTLDHRPSACILGNFDRSEANAGTKTVTALVLKISGIHLKSGLLEYRPLGKASFGFWMDLAGYVPITQAFESRSFSFAPSTIVQFRFWFNPEATGTQSEELSCGPVRSHFVPHGTTSVNAAIGKHIMELKDTVGFVGYVVYEIQRLGYSEDQMQPDQEEQIKFYGRLSSILIDPQYMFARII